MIRLQKIAVDRHVFAQGKALLAGRPLDAEIHAVLVQDRRADLEALKESVVLARGLKAQGLEPGAQIKRGQGLTSGAGFPSFQEIIGQNRHMGLHGPRLDFDGRIPRRHGLQGLSPGNVAEHDKRCHQSRQARRTETEHGGKLPNSVLTAGV